MQCKSGAPGSLRPPSPSRHVTTKLSAIPETSPGPNAFAQQAARLERHRLDGNAFYQQEVARRRVTPPTAIHPALRPRGTSDTPAATQMDHEVQRESTVTTMSPLINAGKAFSPLLRLVPSMTQLPQPTQRGYIEEQREQMVHQASGDDGERVPVYNTFVPTPKPPSGEFTFTSTPKKSRVSLPRKDATVVEAKSPKKPSFFDRLRMTKITSTPSPSITTLASIDGTSEEVSNAPPKAQAVLGASSSKTSLTRTPSKQKRGIFALRRIAEPTDVDTSCRLVTGKSAPSKTEEPPRTADSSVVETPQSTFSDPTVYTYQNGRRIPPRTVSERGALGMEAATKCMVQRSQSLKYIDSVPPPTPPAKNTPPHEKAKQEAVTAGTNRILFPQTLTTPSKGLAGIISTSEDVSPTKFGSYGHREMPTLVTKPSMYSLHASVVPEMCEATKFEEMKARIDGLGLEGFSMPKENYYHRNPEMTYSPSVYSNDWGARASIISRTPRSAHRKTMDDLPPMPELSSESDRNSQRTKQSTSSGFTIPIVYPELALDPSVSGQTAQPRGRPVSDDAAQFYRSAPGYLARKESLTHGSNHSRHHSSSPHRAVKSSTLAADYKNSPHYNDGPSAPDADSFVIPPMEELYQLEHCSPASYHHPSAKPSPLHYLPATVYTPLRATKTSGLGDIDTTPSTIRCEGGFDRDAGQPSVFDTPSRGNDLLEKAPFLQPTRSTRSSPRPSFISLTEASETDVDPTKPGASGGGVDKQDQIVEMLNRLLMQNQEMTEMRDELRASNARSDERMSVVEDVRQALPPQSHSQPEEIPEGSGGGKHRVATSFAHDFYRRQSAVSAASTPPDSAGASGKTTFSAETSTTSDARSDARSDTIAELQETNRQLAEMVRGFAAKLQEMEKRMDGGV
ncbi:hypothetical protein LTR08_005182 [Meristemomyces frigidus]|nr:hypothetical protein LTR08_005182 [Meristemomyces frigidus]